MSAQTLPIQLTGRPILHQHKNGYWVTNERIVDGKPHQHQCNINVTGKLLLQEINGERSLPEVISNFCTKYDLNPADASPWIISFIKQMTDEGVTKISNQTIAHTKLVVIGSDDSIFPVHASLEVTDKCNLECSFCYFSAGPNNKNSMSFVTAIRIMDELRTNGTTMIDLTGGEFFLNHDAAEILEYACRNFAHIGLLTNGTHIPQAALDILTEHKNKVFVNVSIDSTNPELHNRIRGARNAFERSVASVKRLTSNGIKVRIASVIFQDNMWEIESLAKLAIELGAFSFSFNFVEGFGRGEGFRRERMIPQSFEYGAYLRRILKKYESIIPIIKGEEGSDSIGINCGAGTNGITISADGSLRPCPLFPKNSRFGDFHETSLTDIFGTDIYNRLLDVPAPSSKTGCPTDCPHYYECHMCFLRGLQQNIHRSSNDYCKWVTLNNLYDLVDLIRPKPVALDLPSLPLPPRSEKID